ncbi:hypothetical protein F443_15671 [Phytophthora nicotianae P1569]|uniref:Tc1-like transposase DDE domain-containing protein n=1 Tax=Phytophthora nicotianae P1569 TaxID=1317065 RepID=V9EHE4_PHYNI|nr:hypothetical protein F443_15671 [Phytophthora nicotianae P1569]
MDHKNRPIYIQQDNAKPHVSPRDSYVMNTGQSDGWNIVVMFQPPNSPDLNVLDLGFFASIQSIQYKKIISGIENLILAVKDAFDSVDIETIDNIFVTLAKAMECIIKEKGDNTYKLPHMG